MPFTIVTWNVNSVRKRIDAIADFTRGVSVDVLCLQETKAVNDVFPVDAIREMGFPYQAINGMKGYNGVAILSRRPLSDVEVHDWCDKADCRHIQATVETGARPIEVHNLYVPAGGDDPDPERNPKFAHKLAFIDAVTPFMAARGNSDQPAVLCGDLNIAPLESDVWSHERLRRVITHTPIERERLIGMQQAGAWVDALRRFVPADEKAFTWWSYRAADWQAANKGRRLDHVWVDDSLAPTLSHAVVHDEVRGWPVPSDHAPVRVVFEFN